MRKILDTILTIWTGWFYGISFVLLFATVPLWIVPYAICHKAKYRTWLEGGEGAMAYVDRKLMFAKIREKATTKFDWSEKKLWMDELRWCLFRHQGEMFRKLHTF